MDFDRTPPRPSGGPGSPWTTRAAGSSSGTTWAVPEALNPKKLAPPGGASVTSAGFRQPSAGLPPAKTASYAFRRPSAKKEMATTRSPRARAFLERPTRCPEPSELPRRASPRKIDEKSTNNRTSPGTSGSLWGASGALRGPPKARENLPKQPTTPEDRFCWPPRRHRMKECTRHM